MQVTRAVSAGVWVLGVILMLALATLAPSVAFAEPAPVESSAPAQAPKLPETEIVRSPDVGPPPTPQMGVLEAAFPPLRESMAKLPPFFRDTDLNLHLRTFYFNRQNDNDTASEAWAFGGWVQYASGWLADTFAIGATYYMSFPLYAPDDRGGPSILTPGQDTIGTFGEAWAAVRYKDYALLRGGRQKIDEGYLNPQDNRMVPNTFEALLLGGKVGWVQYDVGYVWTIKPRDSNDFIAMSRPAGASGEGPGRH